MNLFVPGISFSYFPSSVVMLMLLSYFMFTDFSSFGLLESQSILSFLACSDTPVSPQLENPPLISSTAMKFYKKNSYCI